MGLALTAALALVARPLFGAVGFLWPYAGLSGYVFPLDAIASVRVASA